MSEKTVPVDRVIRGGALIVGALSVLSLIAYFLSGAILIQPLLAILLLIVSIGFFVMTLVPDSRRAR